MFDGVIDWLSDTLNAILSVIIHLLPDSPFHVELPTEVKNILSYINWVIPFDLMSYAMLSWVAAIIIYYAYMTILRWTKAIE